MIVWTKKFPKHKRVLGYIRLLRARNKYFDHFILKRKRFLRHQLKVSPGYQTLLRNMRDKHQGKRCFIIGNGPSLKKLDIGLLKDEITIGSNGIYKAFSDWGFNTDYIMFEDTEQTELRGEEIFNIQGSTILSGIYNAYAFKPNKNTLFMNVRRADSYYWKNLAPMFSCDFSEIVYLGSTVTYLAMQLAFHLGCNPVYLIGVDHDYGVLPEIFPPGKITIDETNIHKVRGIHFDDNYYKIGDQIGVPHILYQEQAYREARRVYKAHGRELINAGIDSKLEIFKRCDFNSLFS